MKVGIIRTIAICLIHHQNQLLVMEGFDEVKHNTFFRPLGGTIEFGERGIETIARDFGSRR